MSRNVKTDHEFNKELFAELLVKAIHADTLCSFAERANISKGLLSLYVNKKRETPPEPRSIQRIAEVTRQVSLEELLEAAGYDSSKHSPTERQPLKHFNEEDEVILILRDIKYTLPPRQRDEFFHYVARNLKKYKEQIICLYMNQK